ncbi:hypothetical protein [Actinomadura sp. WMMB 499]|uniref:hypothetical protein n=1 Tax=Actinomadura sp. WMMB 499 TaxID=1219491 RepID=UPI0012480638|nr:hypothetical protein [Actinomadura sp. WMMB 499]QFG23006.1 hypothetical protein F7P10_19665 [Actinomadura sp. WMMB 499]
MSSTALLVPGTARADVTDVSASVEFDRLSPDRVATITLEAKSESGITDVEASLENSHLPDVTTPIGTLPLALVDGTVNDGTWRAEYEVDIETHPGFIGFDVAVTTADGATLTRQAGIGSCYQGQFADLTTTPAIVDPDERGVEVKGRLLVRKTQGADPEPAPQGVEIRTLGDTSARVAADGSFTLTSPSTVTRIHVPAGQVVCNLADDAPEADYSEKPTEISASIVTPQPVAAGTEVTVEGIVRREGANGFEPLNNMTVAGYTTFSKDREVRVAEVDSAEDGTFRFSFTARASGPVLVQTEDTSFLTRSRTSAGRLSVTGAPEFAGFTAVSQPGAPGASEDTVIATGRLVNGDAPIPGERIYLERSGEDQLFWTEEATGVTAEDGSFSLSTGTRSSHYWRVRSEGSDGNASTMSVGTYVKVRQATHASVTAEPGADGLVTLTGSLERSGDAGGPVSERPVHFYFQPEGEATWVHRGWPPPTPRAPSPGSSPSTGTAAGRSGSGATTSTSRPTPPSARWTSGPTSRRRSPGSVPRRRRWRRVTRSR